jgi:arabinoxylan arabinofuranohydrolase
MSNKMRAMRSFVPGFLFFAGICFADNPVVQTNFTADPAPMVLGDTVFLYTGHDEDNAGGFIMYNYLLYTSTDLVNWTDHGIVASSKNFSWANSNGAWASQCIPRDGKFYYYCAMQLKGIGVLVSNSPYGPFTDPLGKPLITNGEIDPTVFIDDDGQAYLFFGNPDCRYVKLNRDMISYSGSVVTLPKLQTYQEGPWFYKRNNHYYLAWASTCCPEGIGYAMADAATGPWTYKGSIMDGNSNSSGNQPGIFDYKGKSYTFGFNYAINYSLTTVHNERRSVCLAALSYNTDGAIPKLPWFGGALPEPGVPQVGTLNPYDTVQAETICFEKGVRTEVCKDDGGKMDVDSIHNGDFIKVKGVDFKSGAKSFEARVASAISGGTIELHLDTITGPVAGTCAVAGTGGWQAWATKSCAVSGATGVHDLYLKFTGGSGVLFNFNWWKFTPVQQTGIGVTEANAREGGSAINVTDCAGKTRTLRFDFPRSVSLGNVKVCLFDVAGRLVTTLFTGRLSSSHPAIPFDQAEIRTGAYLIGVSLNGKKIILKKSLVIE